MIIGSGDLFDPYDIVSKLKTSGVDGVAIARGAIGNPWLFTQIKQLLQGQNDISRPTLCEQGRVILEHFEMVTQLYKTAKAIRYFRKFLAQYCKLHPQKRKARAELMAATNPDQLHATIRKWYGIT